MGLLSCAALLAAVLALGSCSREEQAAVPAACLEGAEAVQEALAAAPGAVTVDGTKLSECVARAQTDSDLQNVGAILTRAAERLERRARTDARAALELGYLAGATRRGAGDNIGVQEELARRVGRSTSLGDDAPPEVVAALEEGMRAGARGG